MEIEKVKEIKKALEERTQHTPANCYNGEYVEACGIYCRFYRQFVADMGSKNGQTCKNCSDFIATDEVKEYADILTLIDELESENDTLHTNLCEWRKENQQLKDRINELEKEKTCEYVIKTIKQETAAKILNEMVEYFRSLDQKSFISIDLFFFRLEAIVKKIGAEIKE